MSFSWLVSLFLLDPALVNAATLELSGLDNQILFGSGARLSASCTDLSPSFISISPSSVDLTSSGNLTIDFINVRPTCVDAGFKSPCARHDHMRPELFYALFSGDAGGTPLVAGPVAAYKVPVEMATSTETHLLGIAIHASVPIPSIDSLVVLTNYNGQGGTAAVTVTISFFQPTGSEAVSIPFAGVAGGDVLALAGLYTPPMTPPPPPPLLPPHPNLPPPGAPSPQQPPIPAAFAVTSTTTISASDYAPGSQATVIMIGGGGGGAKGHSGLPPSHPPPPAPCGE